MASSQEPERAQAVLNEKLRLSGEIINGALEAIAITNSSGKLLVVNTAFSLITSYSKKEALNQSILTLAASSPLPTLTPKLWKEVVTKDHWEGELWIKSQNEKEKPVWMAISHLKSSKVPRYSVRFTDSSNLHQAKDKIQELAYFDPLTSLPNRYYLNERLELHTHAINPISFALFLLDLNRFKIVNDTFGHMAGDFLLKKVAERLQATIKNNELLARIGDDEFAIVLFQNDELTTHAVNTVDRLIDSFKEAFDIYGHEIYTTPSVGISLYPSDTTSASLLHQNAEVALFQAKKNPQVTYHFYNPSLNAQAMEHFFLENSLRHAMNREEFELYYQPQIDLRTGKVGGTEALIRWKHPKLGLIGPSEFLPLAEEVNLILPISSWVFQSACQQLKIWEKEGLSHLHLAVNISGQELQLPNFSFYIRELIEKTAINPENLEIEFTENILLESGEFIPNFLNEVGSLGVGFAIDDFGTGYSSLVHLKKFPASSIKIDRSFVADCLTNPEDAAIITAIISMSHSLNLKVIAEGVENEQQLAFLRKLNCDLVQGYYFSAPLSSSQFIDYTKQLIN